MLGVDLTVKATFDRGSNMLRTTVRPRARTSVMYAAVNASPGLPLSSFPHPKPFPPSFLT